MSAVRNSTSAIFAARAAGVAGSLTTQSDNVSWTPFTRPRPNSSQTIVEYFRGNSLSTCESIPSSAALQDQTYRRLCACQVHSATATSTTAAAISATTITTAAGPSAIAASGGGDTNELTIWKSVAIVLCVLIVCIMLGAYRKCQGSESPRSATHKISDSIAISDNSPRIQPHYEPQKPHTVVSNPVYSNGATNGAYMDISPNNQPVKTNLVEKNNHTEDASEVSSGLDIDYELCYAEGLINLPVATNVDSTYEHPITLNPYYIASPHAKQPMTGIDADAAEYENRSSVSQHAASRAIARTVDVDDYVTTTGNYIEVHTPEHTYADINQMSATISPYE